MYAVEYQGLYRDAYDPITQNVHSLVAFFNDPLDESLDNSEFFVHKDKSHLLTVRATKDIPNESFGCLPYGGSFWCNAIYPLETLIRAIQRYSINIYNSTIRNTGDWKSLPQFDKLSAVLTPLERSPRVRQSATTARFLLFPGVTACSSRLDNICQGADSDYRSDGPLQTPIWYNKKQMISLRGGMLDDKVIHYFLKLLCDQVKNLKFSTVDPLHITEYFNSSDDAARIHRHIYRCSDLCDSDFVIFPFNRDLHWSLITADFTTYPIVTLYHEDPLHAHHNQKTTHLLASIKHMIIAHWQWRQSNNSGPVRLPPESWHLTVVVDSHITQRADGISCGAICVWYAMCARRRYQRNFLHWHTFLGFVII